MDSDHQSRRYFDNTMLGSYKRCPREYFLRHVMGWTKDGIGKALVFGLSWHAAMDVVWTKYGEVELEQLFDLAGAAFDQQWVDAGGPEPSEMRIEDLEAWGARNPMVAREMLRGYVVAKQHILRDAKLIACEQPFAVPLPVDNSQPGSTWYAGRLDKVVDYRDEIIALEHKTTSEYKVDGGFKQAYLEGWYLDSQIMGYLYAGSLYFNNLSQVWVDASLVHKKVHNAFKFIPVSHKWQMLEEWISDVREWLRRITREEAQFKAQKNLSGGLFPKQSENCMGKYGPCQFVNICRTTPDPSQLSEVPDGFKLEPWSPFDVLKLHKLLQGDSK